MYSVYKELKGRAENACHSLFYIVNLIYFHENILCSFPEIFLLQVKKQVKSNVAHSTVT